MRIRSHRLWKDPPFWFRPVLIAFLLLVAVVLVARYSGIEPAMLVEQVDAVGPWAPLVFMALYVVAGLLFVPVTPLIIAAGVLFGPLQAVVVVWLASMVTAALAFGVGRFGGGPLQPFLHRKVGRIMRFLDAHGLGTVMGMRMVPVFPFSVLNYGLGFASMRTRDYLIGSAVGMLPLIVAYVLVGAAIGAIDPEEPLSLRFVVLMIGGLLLVGAVGWAGDRLRRRMRGIAVVKDLDEDGTQE